MDSKNLDFHEIWFTKSKETYQNFYFALKFPSFLLNSCLLYTSDAADDYLTV